MNKKTIIIGVLVGVAIIGGIYLYNKNKKANESNDTGMTTEKDALEFADKLKIQKSKKSSDYTSQDKLYQSTLSEKVFHPIGLK